MLLPEFRPFVRDLAVIDPADRGVLKQHILRAQELRALARERGATGLSFGLNAIGNLLAAMAAGDGQLDAASLQSSMLRLAEHLAADLERAPMQPGGQVVASAPVSVEVAFDIDAPEMNPAGSESQAHSVSSKRADHPLPRRRELLGSILLALGNLPRKSLADALRMHRKGGLPIGECLLMSGAMTPDQIMHGLGLQERLRLEHDMQADQRQKASVAAAQPRLLSTKKQTKKYKSIRSAPQVEMHVTKQMFLGEVFLGADMITLEQLEQGMHLHHLKGIRIGEALVRSGAISAQDLVRGLELQQRLRSIAMHSSADAGARRSG